MTMESRKEKVLEIAKHAGFVVDISGHDERNSDLHYMLDRVIELTVKECASIAAKFSMEDNHFHPDINPVNMPIGQRMVYHSTCQSVSYEIKQHFGVEEQTASQKMADAGYTRRPKGWTKEGTE